jgi:hypothetical protein
MLVQLLTIVRSGGMLPAVDQNNAPYYRKEAERLRIGSSKSRGNTICSRRASSGSGAGHFRTETLP